jgi:HK97 gp10 family phage protein
MIYAPVKTGFLRNSMDSRATPSGAEMIVQATYSPYVELGTRKWAGKPFVRPAIDEHAQDIIRVVIEQIQRSIKEKI